MTLELDDRRVRVFIYVTAVPATSRVIQDSDSGAAILLPGQPRQVEFPGSLGLGTSANVGKVHVARFVEIVLSSQIGIEWR